MLCAYVGCIFVDKYSIWPLPLVAIPKSNVRKACQLEKVILKMCAEVEGELICQVMKCCSLQISSLQLILELELGLCES